MRSAKIKKHDLSGLTRHYQAALREHVERKRPASLQPAEGLGRRAMHLGLETLELARMHEQALIALVLPSYSAGVRSTIVRRAGAFFAEVITPIERTHRIALETSIRMARLNDALRRRGADLAAANRRLRQEIAQREMAEAALRKSQVHYGKLLEQSRRMQEQLRRLSRQLLSAQEEERKKISRDLHDVIAQTLTTINVRLASLKREAALNTAGLERSIAHTQKLIERSVDIVHRFARQLRPTVLDDLGLVPALQTFAKTFSAETGIRVSLSAFAEVEQVTGEKRTVLYRVAQEALTNIARHAQASQAQVKIDKLDGYLRMKIKDNGKGFQEQRVFHTRRGARLGLLGMSERLYMVGGKFTISSAPGKGTTVLAQIPLIDQRPEGGGGSRSNGAQ